MYYTQYNSVLKKSGKLRFRFRTITRILLLESKSKSSAECSKCDMRNSTLSLTLRYYCSVPYVLNRAGRNLSNLLIVLVSQGLKRLMFEHPFLVGVAGVSINFVFIFVFLSCGLCLNTLCQTSNY